MPVEFQRNMNTMKQTYTWGGVDELIMLAMLPQINVSLIDASNTDPSKWVITEVCNEASFGILNDPFFGGKSLMVLFIRSIFRVVVQTIMMLYTSFSSIFSIIHV